MCANFGLCGKWVSLRFRGAARTHLCRHLLLAWLVFSPCRCCSLLCGSDPGPCRVQGVTPSLCWSCQRLWKQARPGGAPGSPCLLGECFLRLRLLALVHMVWAPLNFTLTLARELLADVEGQWGFPAMPFLTQEAGGGGHTLGRGCLCPCALGSETGLCGCVSLQAHGTCSWTFV